MRTTLTLEPDVVHLLGEETRRQRKPFKHVVNEALRRGLAPQARAEPRPRFVVEPHVTRLQPGIDTAAFNQLADALEDEAVLDTMRRATKTR